MSSSFHTFQDFATSLSFQQIDSIHFVHQVDKIWLIFIDEDIAEIEMARKWQQKVLQLRNESWKVRVLRKEVWDQRNELIQVQIKCMLRGLTPVFARDLSVIRITSKEASEFLNKHHLLGATKGNHFIALSIPAHRAFRFEKKGLNGIVAVAVFGRNMTRKKVGFEGIRSIEWIRFATLPSIRIVGGITKVFDFLFGLDAYDDMMTYVDIESNDAKGLQRLGFQVEEITSPIQLVNGFNLGNYKLRYGRP